MSLDTWYSVSVQSNADNTVELAMYDRSTSALVDTASYWHDACGTWNFHFAAAGTADLDNVMVVPEPTSLILLGLGAVTLYRRKRQS